MRVPPLRYHSGYEIMSEKHPLTPYRPRDAADILDMLVVGQPISLVGLSNFGKSTLLRHMAQPAFADTYAHRAGHPALFVYVDCNRMLEMSAQGFYEVILRAANETLTAHHPVPRPLLEHLDELYQTVVRSQNSFTIPLAFNDALVALIQADESQEVILMLDEFDAVLTGLEERVFLNLRALKDNYTSQLNYVIATLRPTSTLDAGDDLAEFLEPFGAYKHYLEPLPPVDAERVAADIFHQAHDSLDPAERDFILIQAGGHPGLIHAVAHVVMEVESGAPVTYTEQALSVANDVLENHRLVRSELAKLWNQLAPSEREWATLVATQGVDALSDAERATLLARGVLISDEQEIRLFGQLFENYARRQRLVRQEVPAGVWVDVAAGVGWGDGRRVEPLTDLEYRLLLLLYGRLDKICDKYQIVDTVWGQDYMGEVDDARIEKLVSRLRSKLEPNPSNPQFISTIRGRGYKLNSVQVAPN